MRTAMITATLLFSGLSALAGQSVRGLVVDAQTRKPVANVVVRLLDENEEVATTKTDSAGLFTIRTGESGAFQLGVGGEGYPAFRTEEFEVGSEEEALVAVRVSETRVPEEPLQITGRRRDAFHDATYAGVATRAASLPDIGPNRVFLRNDEEMRNTRDAIELLERYGPLPRCVPTVFWNGYLVQDGAAVAMLETATAMLQAVELYDDPLMAPLSYRDQARSLRSWRCGMVALWSVRG